eukprot:scaffold19137_cov41-Phaeocystis_antarctica.AAC.4
MRMLLATVVKGAVTRAWSDERREGERCGGAASDLTQRARWRAARWRAARCGRPRAGREARA